MRRLSATCLAGAGTLLLATTACAQRPAAGVPGPGETVITEELIRRHVLVIADDSMLGRNTPSPGLEKTAGYVASQFTRLGLTPAGDGGSFLQRYPLAGGATVHGPASPEPATAPNVVGVVRGTDPELRQEYVVISAHMDHVGTSGGSAADTIWNGADDDASGTAGVLALAEAFAKAPPKRSLIFLTVSGEEHGLWGSAWFTTHPPVPLDRIVANLNLDMIGRNWKDSIVVIGVEHSDLGATVAQVAATRRSLGITPMRDPWPQESFFTRSDHYNFARRGVPALFFFNGVHDDYHQPSDSPDKIDAEKESRVVRFIYYVALSVANAPARPRWNEESFRKIVKP